MFYVTSHTAYFTRRTKIKNVFAGILYIKNVKYASKIKSKICKLNLKSEVYHK